VPRNFSTIIGTLPDFFAAFVLEDLLILRLFHYHQGIEKLCKAYLIGTQGHQFESLDSEQAARWIDDYARKLHHNIHRMLCLVNSAEPSIEQFGRDKAFIDLLMKGYEEGRYPKPPSKSIWRDPGIQIVVSTDTDQKAYRLGAQLLSAIRRRYKLSIEVGINLKAISEEQRTRFVRIWDSRSGAFRGDQGAVQEIIE
jgi:hypothetical protein